MTTSVFATCPRRRSFTPTETGTLMALMGQCDLTTATDIVQAYREKTGDVEHTIAAIYTEVGDIARVIPTVKVSKEILNGFSQLRTQEEVPTPRTKVQAVPNLMTPKTVQAPVVVQKVLTPEPLKMVAVGGGEDAPAGYMTGGEVDEYLAEFPVSLREQYGLDSTVAVNAQGKMVRVYTVESVERVERKIRAQMGKIQASIASQTMEHVRAALVALDLGVLTPDEAMMKIRAFTA
jgi:hypothetical protein